MESKGENDGRFSLQDDISGRYRDKSINVSHEGQGSTLLMISRT